MRRPQVALDATGHRLTAQGEVIHSFHRVGEHWVCRVKDCNEKRDKHGKQPKVRHLRAV